MMKDMKKEKKLSVSTKKAIKVYDENEDYAKALMIFIETEVPEDVKTRLE